MMLSRPICRSIVDIWDQDSWTHCNCRLCRQEATYRGGGSKGWPRYARSCRDTHDGNRLGLEITLGIPKRTADVSRVFSPVDLLCKKGEWKEQAHESEHPFPLHI
jgi:hypothetical protein